MALVYQHTRLDTNDVFYIGISSNYKRAYQKADKRNIIWGRIVKKTDYKIDIIAEDLTWEQACKLEIELIAKHGRIDLGNGTLANLTSGGDGSFNRIQTQEEKEKRANSIRGMKRNDETKRKISLAHKGKVFSDESKKRMSDAHIGQISANAKIVLDLQTGIFFDSLRSACELLNIKYKNQFALMSRNSLKSRFTFI